MTAGVNYMLQNSWVRSVQTMLILTLGILLLGACGAGGGEEEESSIDEGAPDVEDDAQIVTIAEDFIQLMSEGRFEEAAQSFDPTMEAELTPDGLADTWEMITAELGELQEHSFDRVEHGD